MTILLRESLVSTQRVSRLKAIDSIYGTNGIPETTSLFIPEDGMVKIGDFNVTAKELILCLKAAKELAKKEYPEEFV